MTRTTKTISFSLSPDLSVRLDELASQQSRTRSALIRDALVRYIEDEEWRELLAYGEERAQAVGIRAEDVPRLIDEYRTEMTGASSRPR